MYSHHFCLLASEITCEAGSCREEEDAGVLSALPDPKLLLDGELVLLTEAEH